MNSAESVLVDDQPESTTSTGRYKTKYKTAFLYLFDFFKQKIQFLKLCSNRMEKMNDNLFCD